ncbi:MAG: transglutaminase domain-containing protein [Planctomycetaceae bacterium]|nr:transglutaminase domain-containing protein [Planctomycetaceae bacterium]
MNAQRSLGFALVVLQAAALAYCFRTPLLSGVVVAVALVGWLSNLRLATPDRARQWPVGLVVLYLIQRTTVPPAWYSGTPSLFFSDSCLIAEYFLVFQVAQFFVRREDDRLPSYLPILAIVAFTCLGDFRASDQARLVFQGMSIGLIALTAGYFAACRLRGHERSATRTPDYPVLLGIVLLMSGGLGWAGASSLYHHAREIEMLLGAVMNPHSPPQSAGFSGQGRLGSVAAQKAGAGSRVALRIYADDSPGYLRGRAFATYDRAEWHAIDEWATLTPEKHGDSSGNVPPDSGDLRTFSLIQSDPETCYRLEIWPNERFEETVFVPPGLVALQMPVDKLSVDMHGIIQAEETLPAGTAYVALTSEDMFRLPDALKTGDTALAANAYARAVASADWARLTALPDNLDPRILALAARVAGQETTSSEKIAAVERYFLSNHKYQFGIDIPPDTDPLTYFLLEKPPAHCEFFASGAVVLLRAVGVPCRYVTGFVAAERNDYGDYWVARNRDAHAWAEAFDPERGWVVVEATPASGVPQASSAPVASQVWDALRAQWQRLLAAIRREGMRAVLHVLLQWFAGPWFVAVLLVLATGIWVRRLRRRRRRKPARTCDPSLRELQRLLQAMDRRWQKVGLMRHPHETLHQFAERMTSATSNPACRQAAQWYRQFAAVRFGGRVDAASVQQLQQSFACPVQSEE